MQGLTFKKEVLRNLTGPNTEFSGNVWVLETPALDWVGGGAGGGDDKGPSAQASKNLSEVVSGKVGETISYTIGHPEDSRRLGEAVSRKLSGKESGKVDH